MILLMRHGGLLMCPAHISAIDPAWFSANAHFGGLGDRSLRTFHRCGRSLLSATQTPQAGVVWLALGCSLVGRSCSAMVSVLPGRCTITHRTNGWTPSYAAITAFALCLVRWVADRIADSIVDREPSAHLGDGAWLQRRCRR